MKRVIYEEKENSIYLLADETDLDYYTNIILELSTDKGNFLLLKDNILFFNNVVAEYINNIDGYVLDSRLNEREIGLLFNEYYYSLFNNIESNKIVLDDTGEWIGSRYCCFSNQRHATWIYKYGGNIYIKVTPVFMEMDKDNNQEDYNKFIANYADIFTGNITYEELEDISKLTQELVHNYIH